MRSKYVYDFAAIRFASFAVSPYAGAACFSDFS